MKFDMRTVLLGGLLSLSTAIGCIFYGRLVKSHPFLVMAILRSLESIIIIPIAFWMCRNEQIEWAAIKTGTFALNTSIYLLTAITAPLWYMLTRETDVAVASSFEGTYVFILILFGILGGLEAFTWRYAVGCTLMFAGIAIVGWR